MHRGYIKLWRKIEDNSIHPLNSKRPFTQYEAWIDLICLANHKERWWEGLKCQRGELLYSSGWYAKRWAWGRQKVRTLLDHLQQTQNINQQNERKTTRITICNYSKYQDQQPEDNQPDNQQITSGQPADNQRITTTKELKALEELKALKKELSNHDVPWRNSFEIYKKECEEAFNAFADNSNWMAQRQEFYPNLDIFQTMRKAAIEFWETKAGWEHKKKSKVKEIDWGRTILNAISLKQNQVYKIKTKDGAYAR